MMFDGLMVPPKRNIAAVYTRWSQRNCVALDDLVAPEKIIERP